MGMSLVSLVLRMWTACLWMRIMGSSRPGRLSLMGGLRLHRGEMARQAHDRTLMGGLQFHRGEMARNHRRLQHGRGRGRHRNQPPRITDRTLRTLPPHSSSITSSGS
jgi:hypothetical protein